MNILIIIFLMITVIYLILFFLSKESNGQRRIIEKEEKVYCKNCIFYKYIYPNTGWGYRPYTVHQCIKGNESKLNAVGNKITLHDNMNCLEKNCNNTCFDYQCKWYKFWVK